MEVGDLPHQRKPQPRTAVLAAAGLVHPEEGLENTALILLRDAAAHPGECRQIDADPDTGCKEFEIEKGHFSFRLTAPYSEERRRAASEAAKNE